MFYEKRSTFVSYVVAGGWGNKTKQNETSTAAYYFQQSVSDYNWKVSF